jgi:hypothetical protein
MYVSSGNNMHQIKKTAHKQIKEDKKASASKIGPRHKTPWEIASKLIAKVPEEAWDNVPSDLSINVDHYWYGAPKQDKL